MKIISSLVFVWLLTGCAMNQSGSNLLSGQVSAGSVTDAIAKLNVQQKEECMKPEYAPLRLKAPCSTKDLTFAQLADTTKMTDVQKDLFMQATTVMDSYSRSITDLYRQTGTPPGLKIADARDWAYAQSTQNRLELVERKITWGNYLKQRQQIEQDMLKRAQ